MLHAIWEKDADGNEEEIIYGEYYCDDLHAASEFQYGNIEFFLVWLQPTMQSIDNNDDNFVSGMRNGNVNTNSALQI